MKIIIVDSKHEVALTVAGLMQTQVLRNPKSVIGLATGKTMEPIYTEFCHLHQKSSSDLSQLHFFMLDEYVALDAKHPSSFKSYIQTKFQQPLKLNEVQFSFPPAHLGEAGGKSYEEELKKYQGVDFQLLGVGRNGHIGFNEPGSERMSLTRVIKLTEDTRDANKSDFPEGELVPEYALSMGIETIFRAKELVLAATGVSKADAIAELIKGVETPLCPVTYLKNHERLTLVLDREAASKLS